MQIGIERQKIEAEIGERALDLFKLRLRVTIPGQRVWDEEQPFLV